MNKLKKLTLALGLVSVLTTGLYVPKAEAGIATIINGIARKDIGGVAAGGLITWAGFAIMARVSTNNPWRVVGAILIVLDAKQPLTVDGIEQYLTKNFTFLDDREAIKDLANLIRVKILENGGLNADSTISIPADEVNAILANSSLSSAQAAALVDALK